MFVSLSLSLFWPSCSESPSLGRSSDSLHFPRDEGRDTLPTCSPHSRFERIASPFVASVCIRSYRGGIFCSLSVYSLPCLSSLAGRLGRIYVFVSLGGQESLIHLAHVHSLNAIQNLTRTGIFFFTWIGTYQRVGIDMLERL